MRTVFGLSLAAVLVLGATADARAQYAFKDEPLMSINRSYLGYSNFVYPGPGLPAHANPPGRTVARPPAGAAAPAPAYVRTPAPAYYYRTPAYPARRWYGWRWGYR